jgi:hypothetical protein
MQTLLLPGFIIVFLVYMLYRILVRQDLRKPVWELYTALLFMGVWCILLYVISC